MSKTYYYQQQKTVLLHPQLVLRILGFLLFIIGVSTVVYVFSPLIIWQFTLAPAIADSDITAPIPNRTLLTPSLIKSLVASSFQNVSGVDYTDATNWFPSYHASALAPKVDSYFLTIPKLGIVNALVSTVDNNLANHLVSLSGTSIPPDKGNTVIFGHSTLPQLFDPKNYKTIFADAYKLQLGDTFTTNVSTVVYTYKIFSITVVDPEDTSVLIQSYDDSYVTLITCTPPGTIWKRLIIKARLQKLT
ncbi:MAG TPA: sortase [Patescibacteria group bacterium]|nr:sortase [Patescibacteria group bacterium]